MKDQKVLEYSKTLKKLGIEHKFAEHPELKTPLEVQLYLGLTLADGLSTLIMKTDSEYVAVVRRNDCRLDYKKIKKILGVKKVEIAKPDQFVKLTNLPVGAARVYNPGLKTLLDRKLFEKEYLTGGTGNFTCSFRYKSQDLKNIPNSTVYDIIETSEFTGIKRVFSGIRATGRLHLGNYLGAVKGMLEIQNSDEYETIYCCVDVHSITTPYDKNELAKNKREIIIDYLAAGLDPKKSILIYQSDIPEHIELAFYFSTVATVARMLHLPTYKDKIKQYPKNVSMALLNYPILMAADILIYKACLVPVGIDQEPHLEVAREVARKMNQVYGTDFPEPVRFATKGEYIPSLKGEGKMSKTVEGSYINLTDSLDEIRKKIRSVPTATVSGGVMSPGIKTLFIFVNLFLPTVTDRLMKEYQNGTLQFVTLKDSIAEAIYKELQPFQERREKIAKDKEYVDRVIKQGAEKARTIARKTVDEVKQKMGLA